MQKIVLFSLLVSFFYNSCVVPLPEYVRPVAGGVAVASGAGVLSVIAYMRILSQEIENARREKRISLASKLERRRAFLKKLVLSGSVVAAMSAVTYFVGAPQVPAQQIHPPQKSNPIRSFFAFCFATT